MKKSYIYGICVPLAGIIGGLLLLAACSDLLAPTPRFQEGAAVLNISVGSRDASARTLFPDQIFTKYVLSFSGGPAAYSDKEITSGTAISLTDLVPGSYTITAKGWVDIDGTEYEAAEGSVTVTLDPGQTKSINIPISAKNAENGADGYFSYNITIPAGKADTAKLYLRKVSGSSQVSEFPKDLSTDPASASPIALPPGYYLLTVNLENDYQRAGYMEIVHIYSNMETKAEHTFVGADFTPFITLSGTLTLSGINTSAYNNVNIIAKRNNGYLAQSDGLTPDNGTPIPWEIHLAQYNSAIPVTFQIEFIGLGPGYASSVFDPDIPVSVNAGIENISNIALSYDASSGGGNGALGPTVSLSDQVWEISNNSLVELNNSSPITLVPVAQVNAPPYMEEILSPGFNPAIAEGGTFSATLPLIQSSALSLITDIVPPGLTVSPSDGNALVLAGFYDPQDPEDTEDDKMLFHMSSNNGYVYYAYADTAMTVTGSADGQVFNIDLQPGWNTILATSNSVNSGAPSLGSKWVLLDYDALSNPEDPGTIGESGSLIITNFPPNSNYFVTILNHPGSIDNVYQLIFLNAPGGIAWGNANSSNSSAVQIIPRLGAGLENNNFPQSGTFTVVLTFGPYSLFKTGVSFANRSGTIDFNQLVNQNSLPLRPGDDGGTAITVKGTVSPAIAQGVGWSLGFSQIDNTSSGNPTPENNDNNHWNRSIGVDTNLETFAIEYEMKLYAFDEEPSTYYLYKVISGLNQDPQWTKVGSIIIPQGATGPITHDIP